MAKYRAVQTSFWGDVKVTEEMTPEDRYFMLYLLTNPKSKQCGCYEITSRQMSIDTGYNISSINNLLNRFINVLDLIEYNNETKEIYIKNWHKYNWTTSPKIMRCVQEEVKSIKNKEFQYNINTLLIGYGYGIDTLSQEKEKEKEKEKEYKKENEEKKQDPYVSNTIIDLFITEYKKQFNTRCYLTAQQKQKIMELNADIEDFKTTIPIALEKSKDIKFKDIPDFKPTANWLLKENNYTAVINGAFDVAIEEAKKKEKSKNIWKELQERELKELAERKKL